MPFYKKFSVIRILCLIMVGLLMFSLCSCSKEENKDKESADVAVTEQTINFPLPKEKRYEQSSNNLGARYTFTLEEFNTMLNEESGSLSSSENEQFFDYKNWELMTEDLEDENGIQYDSYYYTTDTLTITVAVEKHSKKIMNIGCGATYEEFVNSDADYQYTVILTSAIIAMVAGGYTQDDLEFLYYIYFDAAKYDQQFFYNNAVYMMNLSKEKGEEGAVVLFMTSPCKDEILTQWELTDYKKFENSSLKEQ